MLSLLAALLVVKSAAQAGAPTREPSATGLPCLLPREWPANSPYNCDPTLQPVQPPGSLPSRPPAQGSRARRLSAHQAYDLHEDQFANQAYAHQAYDQFDNEDAAHEPTAYDLSAHQAYAHQVYDHFDAEDAAYEPAQPPDSSPSTPPARGSRARLSAQQAYGLDEGGLQFDASEEDFASSRDATYEVWMEVHADAPEGAMRHIDGSLNHFDVLGVETFAPISKIKRAYRKLAVKWHPDKCKERAEVCKGKMERIKAAKEVLTDELYREDYTAAGFRSSRDHVEL